MWCIRFRAALFATATVLLALATPGLAEEATAESSGFQQVVGTTASATTGAFNTFSKLEFSRVKPGGFTGLSPAGGKMMAKEWNRFRTSTRRAASRVGGSGALTFGGAAFMIADVMVDVVARAAGGDFQGATAGAGAFAAGTALVEGASYVSGLAGSALGASLGLAVPVIGPAVGECIGGAVGKVAGGFIAATAYDLLMKDTVTGGIEGALALLWDTRTQLVRDIEARLRRQAGLDMQPIYESYHRSSGEFGLRSVELYGLPTVVYRPRPPSAEGTPEDTPPELVALTSFDAVMVSATVEMADGSTLEFTLEEMNTIGAPLECYILSVRDGTFGTTCDHAYDYPEDNGFTHGETYFKALGVFDGVRFAGTSIDWSRYFNVGKDHMSDGEVSRHVNVGDVTGEVFPDGRVIIVEELIDRRSASVEWDFSQKNGYAINTGEFSTYGDDNPVLRTISTFQIDAASYDGVLLLPNLTATDIDRMEFELPPVFFQHGVSPPERVR